MHIIGNQYFVGVKIKNNDTMHDMKAIYNKTLAFAIKIFEDDVVTSPKNRTAITRQKQLILSSQKNEEKQVFRSADHSRHQAA